MMNRNIRLFSYKLTNDSGFAPNPFFNIMTLATCKPYMRKSKKIGDWIAGFTSVKLCDDKVGEERLIYLMKVTDKILISDYFLNPNFQNKIPDLGRKEFIYQTGDNIYQPQGDGFVQLENRNHSLDNNDRDLSGEFVLISTNFYYFGRCPLEISDDLRPKIPVGQTSHGYLTHNFMRASDFIMYVRESFTTGVHNAPHKWPRNDESWRSS